MRTHRFAPLAALVCAICIGAVVVSLEPITLPSDLDFGPLYRSIQQLDRGEGMYALKAGAVESQMGREDLRGEFPFPGPPWYVAILLPLGFLSPSKAALAWALLNIGLLFGTIVLASRSSSVVSLGVLSMLTLVSAPVQGHLVVGQFSILAGFGYALTAWGARFDRHVCMAMGLVLGTFRPHLGVPFLVVALVRSFQSSRRTFLIRAGWCLVSFAVLLLLALVVDPTSISMYPNYLKTLNGLAVNKVCDTCSSVPIVALRPWQSSLNDLWMARFLLGGMCWVVLVIPLLARGVSGELFLSGAMFVSLLAAPYVRNYDYVLLVPPLIIAWWEARWARPYWGRTIAFSLLLCAILLAGVGPYATGRTLQSNYLWLAPCMGYCAILLLKRGKQTSQVVDTSR
jgi:hypothetical protein